MKKKALFCWSGGKDSAMALYALQKNKDYEITALLTTVTKGYDRISMHGVREVLLDQQAAAIGISLEKVFISQKSSNEEYGAKMHEVLTRYKDLGVSAAVFGDLYLEDVRQYREKQLQKVNMEAIFPIWQNNTTENAHTFIDMGFKTIITCVDTNQLDKSFTGREFSKQFINDLPDTVDPCGENGEFHSFVFDGPCFNHAVDFKKGETVLRDNRFYYCDLVPVE
ncbi:MAG: diphthine--ammonia ligase [Candidatus Margulisiibacteriota bacterium]